MAAVSTVAVAAVVAALVRTADVPATAVRRGAGAATSFPATAAPSPSPSPAPSASPAPPPLALGPAPVQIDTPGWWSWALLDRRTGKIYGSTNMAETSTTASMIKSWIAADYLRRADKQGITPSDDRMHELTIMIRDSDNDAAHDLFGVVGRSESIERLIDICELTDSSPYKDYWSNTRLSARDTARMADCIADGRAAGPAWTDWLINEMRHVRGVGDFGIRKAFDPDTAATIAIKNGWVVREEEGTWHVSCLAIGDGWTMGVMTRYPARLGYAHGAEICESVARQLRTD